MPPEGLNPIELPASAAHVWLWFLRLSNKRKKSMSGFQSLQESEIGWFFKNRSTTPEPWEVDAIDRLDLVAKEEA